MSIFISNLFCYKSIIFIIANLKNAKKCKSKFLRKLTGLQGSIDLESCIISFPKVHYYKVCSVHMQCVVFHVFHLLIWMLLVSVIDKEDKCVYTL